VNDAGVGCAMDGVDRYSCAALLDRENYVMTGYVQLMLDFYAMGLGTMTGFTLGAILFWTRLID